MVFVKNFKVKELKLTEYQLFLSYHKKQFHLEIEEYLKFGESVV